VAEIGHFVAHHHEREKGITTRATREWYAVARFHGVKFGPGGPYALHSDKLPSETSDYLRAAARRMDGKHLRRDAGVSRAEAHNILSKLADRLTKNPNGTYALPSDITKTEANLFEVVASLLVTKPAFDGERLVDDFLETLKSNSLITKQELREHRTDISILVQLYAVSMMHNCVVKSEMIKQFS
jgi:hypothetical protein